MKKVLSALFLILGFNGAAQWSESFADGNFTADPVWSGNTSDWQVVSSSDVSTGAANSNTLRLNVATGSGIKYLSTQVMGSWGVQQSWGFWMGRRGQAATSSNVTYVWLYSSEADVSSTTVDGYRIRFGDDAGGDELVLEAITNGTATPVLTSSGAVANGLADYGFLVRITRDVAGVWTLYTSSLPTINGTGAIALDQPNLATTSIVQGSATNNAISVFDNGYLAVAALHSSAAVARTGVEFDQLSLTNTNNIPLPLTLGSVCSSQTSEGIQISWSNATESEVRNYVLERANDGLHFAAVASIIPEKNNGGAASYHYLDRSALDGNYFYRIAVWEQTGRVLFSSILSVLRFDSRSFVLYPNPVTGNSLEWYASKLTSGNYIIRISNPSGQLITIESFNHTGGPFNQTIPLKNQTPGWYLFELTGPVIWKRMFVVQ